MSDIHHYIEGKRAEGASGRWGDVYNPATGEKSGRVAFAGAAEVDRAVRAAAAAFPAWAATPPLTRARILFKFRELLDREPPPRLVAFIERQKREHTGDAVA